MPYCHLLRVEWLQAMTGNVSTQTGLCVQDCISRESKVFRRFRQARAEGLAIHPPFYVFTSEIASWWLDLMIWKVFSNLGDAIILLQILQKNVIRNLLSSFYQALFPPHHNYSLPWFCSSMVHYFLLPAKSFSSSCIDAVHHQHHLTAKPWSCWIGFFPWWTNISTYA